jgi:hypothetical protein
LKKYGFEASVGGLLLIAVFGLIFAATIPTVANAGSMASSTRNASPLLYGANVTGAAASLTDLMLPLFVIVGIMKVAGFV